MTKHRIERVVETKYVVNGVEYKTEKEAEHALAIANRTLFDKWCLESYFGIELLKKHSLQEYGVWQIHGEDSNADLGGHHSNPYLATVEGSLYNAIKYAIALPRFYIWGHGGEIKKIEVKKLHDEDNKRGEETLHRGRLNKLKT